MKMGFDWTASCGYRSLFYCIGFYFLFIAAPITKKAEVVNFWLNLSIIYMLDISC